MGLRTRTGMELGIETTGSAAEDDISQTLTNRKSSADRRFPAAS